MPKDNDLNIKGPRRKRNLNGSRKRVIKKGGGRDVLRCMHNKQN